MSVVSRVDFGPVGVSIVMNAQRVFLGALVAILLTVAVSCSRHM